MRLPEQRLWDTMKRNRPCYCRMERIENAASVGIPDVLMKFSQTEWSPPRFTFCELKAANRPKRESTRLMGNKGLRKEQINWHLEAASMGLSSWVLIRDSESELYLISGKQAAKVNEMSVPELRQRRIASQWPHIFEVMSKR